MSKFSVGDRVRSNFDERLMVRDNPILMALCEMSGKGDQLRRSLDVMPVPTGTVTAVDAVFKTDAMGGLTLRDMVLINLDDGREEFPFHEDELELIESFDDGLNRVLSEGTRE